MGLQDAIREALAAENRSQAEVARLAKVPIPNLNRFAKGTKSLNTNSLERLADVLGLRLVVKAKGKRKTPTNQ